MPQKQSETEVAPRPTRPAFKPAGKNDFRNDLMIAGFCLAGFLFGLGANLFGDFGSFLDSSGRLPNNGYTPIWLQVLVFFGFPLFLIASIYYLWHALDQRKKTARFLRDRVHGEAQITHLWKVPPEGSDHRFYYGYRYQGTNTAFSEVDGIIFKRLKIGQTLEVDYLPDKPQVSYPVIKLPEKKTTASNSME